MANPVPVTYNAAASPVVGGRWWSALSNFARNVQPGQFAQFPSPSLLVADSSGSRPFEPAPESGSDVGTFDWTSNLPYDGKTRRIFAAGGRPAGTPEAQKLIWYDAKEDKWDSIANPFGTGGGHLYQSCTVALQAGHAVVRGYAPEISQAASIRPDTGHVVAQGYTSSIAQPRALSLSTGHISARGYAPAVQQLSATYPITLAQVRLLYSIYRLHGLAEPLSISPTAREVASLLQSVSSAGASTTVETNSLPSDVPTDPGLLIEELAALHGLTVPLTVATDSRTAGTIAQSFSVTGSSITVTRQ